MSKHTPGPWSGTKSSAGGYDIISSVVTPLDVCVVSRRGKDKAEIDANARLLAAAPELLEALRITRGNVASLGPAGVFEPYTEYREWLAMIDAAIAKATEAA